MNNEDILRMLAEANMSLADLHIGRLTKFAALIHAAAVRETAEECAQLCNQVAWTNRNTHLLGPEMNAQKCEFAIRTKFQDEATSSGGANNG